MRKTLLVAASAVVIAGAGAGVAYASIPDGAGVIHACYKTPVPAHGSTLSVIDTNAGGSCGGGMTAVTWNQTGPQGPTGTQGPAGPQATAQDVISQVTYTDVGTNPSQRQVQLDCPSGTLALNGGVVGADSMPQPNEIQLTQGPTAVPLFGQVTSSDFLHADGLPRPVNGGASWLMLVTLTAPNEVFNNGTQGAIPFTVTYFVICE